MAICRTFSFKTLFFQLFSFNFDVKLFCTYRFMGLASGSFRRFFHIFSSCVIILYSWLIAALNLSRSCICPLCVIVDLSRGWTPGLWLCEELMLPTLFCLLSFAKPTEAGVWLASLCLVSCCPLLPLRVSSRLRRLWLLRLSFSVQMGVLHCKPSSPILIFHLRRAFKLQKEVCRQRITVAILKQSRNRG